MNDADVLELTELCNALADARLADAQRARLNQVLAGSDEARRFYVRFAALSSSMCGYAAELQTERAEKSRVIAFPRALWWGGLAAAAAITFAVTFGWRSRDAAEPESVAWVTDSQDAEWGGAPLTTGDALARGQRVDLRRGTAEFTFDSGARVVLEGPASLDVQSAWSAGLRSGSLTASATAEAVGFRVVNAAVDVTNLGGQVGVVAGGDGATEVYAIEGSAEADQPGRGEKHLLKDKQARRFAREGVSSVKDIDRKLAKFAARTNLDRRGRPINFARWSFDDSLAAQASGFNAATLGARFEDAPANAAETLLQPGRWRRALALDGRSFAAARMPGESPRTVAFWVKVPADAPPGEDVAMLAWKRRGRAAQIAWNRDPERGPLGALRTEQDAAAVVGRTSLRDGQWHHVAVIFLGGGKKGGAAQLKQFVDGRFDGAGSFALRAKNAALSADGGDTLRIGRGAGAHEGFRGELDELFIADRPLAPFEIRQLMEKNEPPGGA